MLKKIFTVAMLACATFTGNKLQAQVDPHFSQYYVYPQWLNPALTGIMDGDYRVAGIYRSQWANIDNGFVTIGVAGEMTTNKDFNIGVGLFQQSAGNGGYKYFTPYASVAYTGIRFGKNGDQHVSIGLNVGAIDRRFDPSKFKFGDQWNGSVVVPTTSEQFSNLSNTAFDIGAGALYYDGDPNKKANLFVGISAGHLTQPADKFAANSDSKVPLRMTYHGGVKIKLSDRVSITPNVLYLTQGTAEEKMLGAYAQIKGSETFDFLAGANYRFKDALVPFVGFYHKQFTLGVSYDVNTSDLSKFAGSANGFEISLSYVAKRRGKAEEKPFICPRL